MAEPKAGARYQAVATAAGRQSRVFQRQIGADGVPMRVSEFYGCNTFSYELMAKKIPPDDVAKLKEHALKAEPISKELADMVAAAVQQWALSRGATHYCHWFQPQTGATAEKHDAFFSLTGKAGPVEKFTGSELIQSEPDASSFPSGGSRTTFEARGYTVWDASSPMFLMERENGLTLCIPSLFISYSGEALDQKTPLLRSIAAINHHASESLKLLGCASDYVMVTAGPEQEYFVVDNALYSLRPDLILAGRALFGQRPPRHQQLEDHYFGSMRPRILNFIMECEYELYKLGVPCKTRHNEVAPAQCETAPIFEQANLAADHNQLVMEVIKSTARKHNLAALFHEKPFPDVNGSGKHVNWSLADSNGDNLLEPGDNPHQNIRFLYFLAATVKAIHDHGALLRMTVASAGNDFRLGANEAPPAIMSVFLGDTLSKIVDQLAAGQAAAGASGSGQIDLALAKVPVIRRDNTDRNRTSPFAFTGNKFEFRAVGASSSISQPLMALNSAVAGALADMNKQLKAASISPTTDQILQVIQKTLKETSAIRFEGNNYSEEWHKEAEKRGLPNLQTTAEALSVLKEPETIKFLSDLNVLTEREAKGRYNVNLERYIKTRLIEMELLYDLVSTHVYPALITQQKQVAEALEALEEVLDKAPVNQKNRLQDMATVAEDLLQLLARLQLFVKTAEETHNEEALATKLSTEGTEIMAAMAKACGTVERIVDDSVWTLPKLRELLYLQ